MNKFKTNIFLLGFLLVVFIGCAKTPKTEHIVMPEPLLLPFTISGVSLDRKVFNPYEREAVMISFRVSRPAKAVVSIFDSDMSLIRELISGKSGEMAKNTVIWDGRDMERKVVPDDAYFFTVEAMDYQGNSAYYDPTTVSGGEFVLPDKVYFDKANGEIEYHLAEDARVKIRAGLASDGPLLNNIMEWIPRQSGLHREPWDGKESAGVIEITGLSNYRLLVEGITLPENSIFTSGNPDYDYFAYKNEISNERPGKKKRPLFQSEMTLLGRQSGVLDRRGPEPKFRIDLPKRSKKENGLPVIKGKTQVKIYLDDNVKRYITEQRYEIIFFVDYRFITEAEEGYSPFTLVWDSRDVSNGKHIITVNVATLTGQVSSASIKVLVEYR